MISEELKSRLIILRDNLKMIKPVADEVKNSVLNDANIDPEIKGSFTDILRKAKNFEKNKDINGLVDLFDEAKERIRDGRNNANR